MYGEWNVHAEAALAAALLKPKRLALTASSSSAPAPLAIENCNIPVSKKESSPKNTKKAEASSSSSSSTSSGEEAEDEQEESEDEQEEADDVQQEPAMPEYYQWTDDWHDVYAQLLHIYESSELNTKRRRIMDTLLADLRKAKGHFDAENQMTTAYKKALDEVKNHVMTELKTPIVITNETVSGSVNDLPLKEHFHQYKAKTLVDIIENVALQDVPWESIATCLANERYTELPPPFRTDRVADTEFVLQIGVIKNSTGSFGTVIKHFIFADKTTSLRHIEEIVHGTGYLIDYSPNFRSGPCAFQILLQRMSHWMVSFRRLEQKQPRPVKEDCGDLQAGFDYIREFGPKSNMGNGQTEWAEIETRRLGGPLHGWSAGLVKECLRNHSASNVYARPVTNFFLTLHDVAGWFFDDVLVEILGDLKSHTLVMMGMAETGKTPVAQAIAMAISEYHILAGGKEQELRPSFRLVASLDQLRGESGIKERPDILDDPDTSVMSVTKLKAFLDSTLTETHTVVRNQLRVICDNRVDDDAEPDLPESEGFIKFETFMDIISPAFPDKCSKQDRMACLKRAHWIVNMKKALYLRPAGTKTVPVKRIPYLHGQTDFLNQEGKDILQAMRDGIETPPKNWVQKRQWTHDVLSMIIEKKERPRRTATILIPGSGGNGPTSRDSKPQVPFSGRICPDFLPTVDTAASMEDRREASSSLPTAANIALKTEVEEKAFFPLMVASHADDVIDLATPTPPRCKRPRQDDAFPDVGEDVDEHCFESDVAFQKYLIHRRVLDENGANVSLSLRAIGIFLKYGAALQIKRCTKCGKPARFEQRTSRGWTTFGWTCSAVGHKHMELQLNQYGFLTEIPVNSWFPFLHLINMLRLSMNWSTIIQELQAGYGNIAKKTIAKWRDVFQRAIGAALDKMDCRVVGGKKETVVMDEAIVGVHPEDGWSVGSRGINKAGAEQTRTTARLERKKLVSKGAMKRLPARTLHGSEKASRTGPQLLKKPASTHMKRPCGVMKTILKKPAAVRPPAKRLKKTAANLKTNGAWLWLAVAVGKNKEIYTHDNGKKRITYRLLPSRKKAIKNKPRGFEEIQNTVEKHVAKGSYLVFDGWTATKKAVEALGYDYAPPVKHEKCFRDPATGFHTNDAESENGRLKKWSRRRYGKLSLDILEMDEYVFYVNVGTDMSSILKGAYIGLVVYEHLGMGHD
ncbi:unnamed protein product [Symbiodinium sp. CCMP2592]|nr:unnamed protein product [Symbiodinium sp. CCMP2592]